MKYPDRHGATGVLLVAAAVAAILAGCASVPKAPPGSMEVRSKLVHLQSETTLASRVPGWRWNRPRLP